MQPFAEYDQDQMRTEEAELRERMKRVAAPAGFAERLMARAEAEPKRGKVLLFRSPTARAWMGGAIAAALTLGVFVGSEVHERRERQQAQVQQQFDTAMQVTDQALDRTRDKLAKAGITLGE